MQYSVAVAGAGYKCSCVEGYELREATCQAKLSFPKMNVLFTNTNAVYMVDPTSTRSNSLHEVLANLTSVSGLDFHYKKKLLFYTDVDKRKVFQVRLDETGRHVVAQHKRDYRCVTRDTWVDYPPVPVYLRAAAVMNVKVFIVKHNCYLRTNSKQLLYSHLNFTVADKNWSRYRQLLNSDL